MLVGSIEAERYTGSRYTDASLILRWLSEPSKFIYFIVSRADTRFRAYDIYHPHGVLLV